MEPVIGFEPTTDGLQNHCSTVELHWHASVSRYLNQLLTEVCIALGTVFMLLQVCVSGLPALPEGATNINYNAPLCTSIIIFI